MSNKIKNIWATELFKLAGRLANKVARAQAAIILVVIAGSYVLTCDLGIVTVSNLSPNLEIISFGLTVLVIGTIVLYALRAITRMQYTRRRKTVRPLSYPELACAFRSDLPQKIQRSVLELSGNDTPRNET